MIEPDAELKAVITRWLRSLSDRDWEAAANMFSPSEQLRYIGTDGREWWSGAEIVRVYSRFMDDMPEMTLEIDPDEVEAFADGRVGWAAARLTTRISGHPPLTGRHTAVCVLERGIWRLVQVHNSIARPNEEIIGVELTTSLEDLLASIADDLAIDDGSRLAEGTVTLVFTDIEESTRRAEALGDRRWFEVIEQHFRLVRSIAESNGGRVVKTLGDGALMAFESTRAAARTAIGCQRAVDAVASPSPLRIRVGVHIGEVVHAGDDVLGHTVNKAARVASAAEGGQIMVSATAHALLAESAEFEFGEPIDLELRGLQGVHRGFPLIWR